MCLSLFIILVLIIVGLIYEIKVRNDIKNYYCEELGEGNHEIYPCGTEYFPDCSMNLSIIVECG